MKFLLSYVDRMNRLPPYVCVLLARDEKIRSKGINHLAVLAGMPAWRARKIASLKSWETVRVCDVEAFRSACGINPSNERRHIAYLKRVMVSDTGLTHLAKKHPATRAKLLRAIKSAQSQSA